MSGYVKQHLPIILVNHLTTERSVQKTLSSGFIEVDRSLANSRIDCEFSGTTAVVSYLKVCVCVCVCVRVRLLARARAVRQGRWVCARKCVAPCRSQLARVRW